MNDVLRLAWRHLTHYWGRATILAMSVALTLTLPVALEVFVRIYGDAVAERAVSTPLIAGAKGSRYDLVLANLYFRGRIPRPLPVAELDRIRDGDLADAIPVFARGRAKGHPLVGTSPEYYDYRGLRADRGTLPLRLGDAVLGAAVADELALGPGDTLLTEVDNTYDLALGYPLRMRITGVLAAVGQADDHAVFVDLKTAWVADGIGHGHDEADRQRTERVMARTPDGIVLDAGILEFTEVTDDNIDSFHFHESREELPLTGILCIPHDDRSATKLKGRYRVSETAQMLEPTQVIEELLSLVFRIKTFYDANALLVSIATGLLLALIVLLSVRVRQREIDTLFRMGCARTMVFRLMATELALTVAIGAVIALALASGLVIWFAGAQGLA